MLWKFAILFLLAMVLIVMIFGRPKAGDAGGRWRLGGRGKRRRPPDDRRG
ncbi:hypothetical protein SAMN05444336_102539 [Albimonas donghaensis]|uniref:Uncharacterized protein n=1 Tax=Albimonas donghaensis TaxID=356660 RepID=A0A1H2WYJ7_9RHOB|nr:hypothetical protein [Albimonas donghaensis]SDW85588.1 hypothetical protein SAMN05444336_102539 [Albimonas donghaensis]